jgi:hypothetical protein
MAQVLFWVFLVLAIIVFVAFYLTILFWEEPWGYGKSNRPRVG